MKIKNLLMVITLIGVILISGCITKGTGDAICDKFVEEKNATKGFFDAFSGECYIYYCKDIDGYYFCKKELYEIEIKEIE